jgi:hypothetical protein
MGHILTIQLDLKHVRKIVILAIILTNIIAFFVIFHVKHVLMHQINHV